LAQPRSYPKVSPNATSCPPPFPFLFFPCGAGDPLLPPALWKSPPRPSGPSHPVSLTAPPVDSFAACSKCSGLKPPFSPSVPLPPFLVPAARCRGFFFTTEWRPAMRTDGPSPHLSPFFDSGLIYRRAGVRVRAQRGFHAAPRGWRLILGFGASLFPPFSVFLSLFESHATPTTDSRTPTLTAAAVLATKPYWHFFPQHTTRRLHAHASTRSGFAR